MTRGPGLGHGKNRLSGERLRAVVFPLFSPRRHTSRPRKEAHPALTLDGDVRSDGTHNFAGDGLALHPRRAELLDGHGTCSKLCDLSMGPDLTKRAQPYAPFHTCL